MEKRFGWYNSITNVRDSPPKFQLLWSVYSKNLNQHILAGCLFFIQTSLSMLKSFSNSFHIRPTISMWNACPSLSFPITLRAWYDGWNLQVFLRGEFLISQMMVWKQGLQWAMNVLFGGICYMSSGLFKKMGGTSNCFCGILWFSYNYGQSSQTWVLFGGKHVSPRNWKGLNSPTNM